MAARSPRKSGVTQQAKEQPMPTEPVHDPSAASSQLAQDFSERVRANQQRLTSALKPSYDFIVCGSGSSGSVVARRLAENPDVSVLLLEAGGQDDIPEVMRAEQWPLNLGSEREWNFTAQPNPHLNGRSIPFGMGKVLGDDNQDEDGN
jgi:choline dehydrogenase